MSTLRIISFAPVTALVATVIVFFLLMPSLKQQQTENVPMRPFELVDQDGKR